MFLRQCILFGSIALVTSCLYYHALNVSIHSDFLNTKLIKDVANDDPDLDLIVGHSWVGGKSVHVWNFVAVKSVFRGFLTASFVSLTYLAWSQGFGIKRLY